MKRHCFSPGLRDLKGFSLIELMVSVTIGLLITIAAFSAYLGASTASKIAEAQARMNEDAQAALNILTQQLRMAGNNPEQANRIGNADYPVRSSRRNPVYLPTPAYDGYQPLKQKYGGVTTPFELSAFAIRGCDGKFSNLTAAAKLDNLACVSNTSQPDSIAISYEMDLFNTVGTAPTDCLGNSLPVITATLPTFTQAGTPPVVTLSLEAATYAVADNRFYIGTSRTILSPSLYCKGNGGGPNALQQPLVENIEDLQFTYGTMKVLTPEVELKTAPVAGYLLANEIDAATTVPNDPALWAKVITVRICVLVRSESPVISDSASASYLKCDGSVSAAQPDLRLRRAYSTTVVLRNRRL